MMAFGTPMPNEFYKAVFLLPVHHSRTISFNIAHVPVNSNCSRAVYEKESKSPILDVYHLKLDLYINIL
jgi:hypothetical protein